MNVAHAPGKRCFGFGLFLLYAACFLLVVCYVNMFQLWVWLSRQLGPGPWTGRLPVLVTLAVLLMSLASFVQRFHKGIRVHFIFLALGIGIALLALAVPDPHVPIKRIHVVEYIVLSFLVRFALGHRLQGNRLALFTALVTLLFGIHDEMIQGLHPLRYYGWRDMIVNGLAGCGGALLGHGLRFFETASPHDADHEPRRTVSPGLAFFYVMLFAAVGWLAVSLYEQRGGAVLVTSLLPIACMCLVITVLYPEVVVDSREHHGLQAVFWLALGLMIYPVLINVAGMRFI